MFVRRSLRSLIGFNADDRNRQDGALSSLACHCSGVSSTFDPFHALSVSISPASGKVRRRNYRVLVTRSYVYADETTESPVRRSSSASLCRLPERFQYIRPTAMAVTSTGLLLLRQVYLTLPRPVGLNGQVG